MMHQLTSILAVICLLFSASAFAAAEPIDRSSEKYAAFVMDADTGEVFMDENASKRRYPASLTKMMTLYMLFDALKSGDIKLDTRMAVSARAASQPQTNISLKAGQTIPVRDAIKALVVRSANDVAVVVAEQLGKTEPNFAQLMTRRARSLGMNQTQFRNAHGLPDRQQFTTARDMAKLSIALRRDFPQYYHYFKTQEFSWKGRTYTSHNRVLDQFDGVDGIKTGYINMSGFNLATSVKRDGYHIVGVVMGGQNSRSRDAFMVHLMHRTFAQLKGRGEEPRLFASAPVPKAKPGGSLQVASSAKPSLPWVKVTLDDSAAKPAQQQAQAPAAKAEAKAPKVIKFAKAEQPSATPEKTEAKPSFIRFVSNPAQASAPASGSLNFQLASLNAPASSKLKSGSWGIQVGAFRDEESAMLAAAQAVKLARSELKYSKVNITGQQEANIHRARLANLTETQARKACERLSARSTPCFVFKADGQRNL